MKKLKALLLLSLFPLLVINGCAATKESRSYEKTSNQNNGYIVRLINNTANEISFTYDKFEAKSLTFAWDNLKNGENKLIHLRKDGTLKLKYKKDDKETEENIEITDDKKIEITNQGVSSTAINSSDKSEIHF